MNCYIPNRGIRYKLLADRGRGRGSMHVLPGRSYNAGTSQEIHERKIPSGEQYGENFEPYSQPDAAACDTTRRTYLRRNVVACNGRAYYYQRQSGNGAHADRTTQHIERYPRFTMTVLVLEGRVIKGQQGIRPARYKG